MMNIPAIRAALERLENQPWRDALHIAVVRVGLRACDAWEHGYRPDKVVWTMEVIAEILRESGGEVEG